MDQRDSAIAADMGRPIVAESVGLAEWRTERGLTWRELAEVIGAKTAGQAQAWAIGSAKPSAERIERIRIETGGRVDAYSMHQVRLKWERAHPRAIVDIAPRRKCMRRAA